MFLAHGNLTIHTQIFHLRGIHSDLRFSHLCWLLLRVAVFHLMFVEFQVVLEAELLL